MVQVNDESNLSSLEHCFVEFAEAALKQAAIWALSEGIPLSYYSQLVFENSSSFKRQQLVQHINYHQLFNNNRDALIGMTEAQQCGHLHLQAGIPVGAPPAISEADSVESPIPTQVTQVIDALFYPIVDILQQHNTFSPTPEQIRASYRRFFEAWTATTTREDATIPLLNFKVGQAQFPIRISTHYQIAPFSPAEKTAFWGIVDAFQGWDLFPFFSFLATEFKLEGSRSYPRMQGQPSQQAIEAFSRSHQGMLDEIRDIVTALRLLQAGDVGVTAYVEQDTRVPPYGSGYPHMGVPTVGLSDFRVRRHGVVYSLDEAKIPAACHLTETLQKLNERSHRGGLEVALSRFNQSYGRDFFDDRLIDLTIALESCLLAAIKSQTELKYRFALRGAALLANTRKPQETNTLLLALYNARSSIVHEGKHLAEQRSTSLVGLQPIEFLQSCEDVVRDILRQYVQILAGAGAQSSIGMVNQELDQQILSGLSTPDEGQRESSPG